MAEEWTYDLFVSYAEADKNWVEGYLLDALDARVRCTSESAFTLGVPRILEFERAIRQSRYTLLVISEAYLADDLTRFTDILAESYGEQVGTWPVIPLKLQEELQLPPRLKMLEGLEASNPEQWEAAIERLCHQLQRPLPPPTAKPACPYPGTIPFSESDRGRFFGRDGEIEELLERLRLHPFIAAIGPSGSGKSSLIFAGLIPQLKVSGLFGTGQWCVRSLRPGTSPLANLQAVLGGDLTTLEATIDRLLSTEPDARHLLLVVDQLEELFAQAGAEAIPFQQALLKLIAIPNVYLILTVRADFYPDLMESLLWEKIRSHRFEVLPLDERGLKQAIVKPAEAVEVYIDSALVERLLVDAKGEPGVLPLIQETLVLLWEKLERHYLPLKAYELLVLPRRAYGATEAQPRTGLQVAIARRADAALADLETEAQPAIARRIFLRLIQFGEGRPDTRRQQLQRDLRSAGDDPELFDRTIEHLARCRLLTFSGAENTQDKLERKVDLAHEAIISGWPTLQQWIRERREAEQVRRRLETQAREWVRLGRGTGGLLDAIELAEAERWLQSLDAKELGYSLSLTDSIAASQEAIEAAARLERERQQRELTLIQEKLKQEQKSRKAERMRNRVIIGSLAIVLIGGIFAWLQQQQIYWVIRKLAVGIDVPTPELIGSLSRLADDAKTLSQREGKNAEDAMAYYRYILKETKKLQQNPPNLSPQARASIDRMNREAASSLTTSIVKLHINNTLKNQLDRGAIGKRISNDYRDLDRQFTDALQTTYRALMLDTGADTNRNGNLDDRDEIKSIPCEILQAIENTWQQAMQGRCGFYGENGVFSASKSCAELGGQNLTMTLFPIESQGLVDKHLQACKIHSSQLRSDRYEN